MGGEKAVVVRATSKVLPASALILHVAALGLTLPWLTCGTAYHFVGGKEEQREQWTTGKTTYALHPNVSPRAPSFQGGRGLIHQLPMLLS